MICSLNRFMNRTMCTSLRGHPTLSMSIEVPRMELPTHVVHGNDDETSTDGKDEEKGEKGVEDGDGDADGSIEHYKARIIAKGFSQIYQVNYDETFTPVVKWDSICILLMLTAQYDLKVHQMDVKTVFLNGDLDHAIYMECLQEVPITDPKELCGNSRRVSMVSNKHPGPGTRRQKTNSVILVSPAVMWTIVSLFTMVVAKSFAL